MYVLPCSAGERGTHRRNVCVWEAESGLLYLWWDCGGQFERAGGMCFCVVIATLLPVY